MMSSNKKERFPRKEIRNSMDIHILEKDLTQELFDRKRQVLESRVLNECDECNIFLETGDDCIPIMQGYIDYYETGHVPLFWFNKKILDGHNIRYEKTKPIPDESSVELTNRLKALARKVRDHIGTLYNTIIFGRYYSDICAISIGIYGADFFVPLTPETLDFENTMAGLRNAIMEYKKKYKHFGKLDGLLYTPKKK